MIMMMTMTMMMMSSISFGTTFNTKEKLETTIMHFIFFGGGGGAGKGGKRGALWEMWNGKLLQLRQGTVAKSCQNYPQLYLINFFDIICF